MIGIYKIVNPKGKVYIGQSVDIDRRLTEHSIGKSGSRKVCNSVKKYGWENHTYEVVEQCNEELLNERERHYQELYKSIGKNGLNLEYTPSNFKSGRASEETKKLQSIAAKNRPSNQKGRKRSKETVEKIKKTKKENPQIFTEETRRKLSKAAKNRKITEKTRKKLSTAAKNQSEEKKRQISETMKRIWANRKIHPWSNKSKEHLEKIRNARKS